MAATPPGSPAAAAALPLRAVFRPLLPLFAIDILTAFTVGMVPPLLPLLADEWQLSPLQAGLVNTLYAVGRLGTSYPASALRGRRGTRAVVYLGLALLVAGVVACGLAPGFSIFLLARLVMGSAPRRPSWRSSPSFSRRPRWRGAGASRTCSRAWRS